MSTLCNGREVHPNAARKTKANWNNIFVLKTTENVFFAHPIWSSVCITHHPAYLSDSQRC